MFGDPEGPLVYLIIVLLIFLSAFFAGSESALSSCNRHRIKVKADDGKKLAKLTMKILERFDSTIITILIGTNVCHILCSVLGTIIFVNMIGESGSIVSTVVITIVVFFFGEILPKSIAKANCDKIAMLISIPLFVFYVILWPFNKFFSLIVWIAKKIAKVKESDDDFTDDDFQDVVAKIEDEGVIDDEESDIIQNAVDFGDIKVKEILTVKEDIVGIDIRNCNNNYVKKFITEHSYSRLPVYDKDLDHIVGVLHVRSYLRKWFNNNKISVRSVLSTPYFVNSQISLDEIFEGFKEHKTHIAIVVNNDGKTLGMVTMKDVLEELVSDIDEAGTSPEEDSDNE